MNTMEEDQERETFILHSDEDGCHGQFILLMETTTSSKDASRSQQWMTWFGDQKPLENRTRARLRQIRLQVV
jgi:hypothetical protein